MSSYAKKTSAKATIGESQQIARMVTVPAIITARWAVGISCTAFVVACLAVYLAVVLR